MREGGLDRGMGLGNGRNGEGAGVRLGGVGKVLVLGEWWRKSWYEERV